MREIGAVMAENGFFESADDIFYLNIHEVHEALSDLGLAWSGGTRRARHGLLAAAGRAAQGDPREPCGLDTPAGARRRPEVINDPTVQLLWGVTADRLRAWASQTEDEDVRGYAASPGIAEGLARVVRDVNEIGSVQQGEVLVCSVTAPSGARCSPRSPRRSRTSAG